MIPLRTGFEAVACSAGSEPEEMRYMLFNPNITENKAWWTFFYNYKFTYLNGAVTSNADELEISREWIKELKQDIPVSEAYAFLYTSLSDSQREQNAFYKALEKNEEMLAYFTFANDEIGLVGFPDNVWEEASQDSLRQRGAMLIEKGKQLWEKAPTAFLKKRYAYQLIKLAFYYKQDDLLHQMYEGFFSIDTLPTQLDWWATHYKSVALETTEPDSANYLHALVYSHADSKMFASRQFYSNKNHQEVMALARNDEEKADILILKEAINPGKSLEGIKQIYQLYPTHKHLPMLIIREINKLEDWLSATYTGQTSSNNPMSLSQATNNQNWRNDYQYLQEFYAYLQEMQTLAQAQPEVYQLALTYLSLMQNKPEEAKQYLANISSSNPQILFQVNVLQLIAVTKESDIADSAVQEKMGRLFQKLIATREGVFESQKTLFSLSAYMKQLFAAKGLKHLAGLWEYYQQEEFCASCSYNTFEYTLIRYFDQSASIADIQNVIALFTKKNKNTLEKLLLLPYSNPYYFMDLLSVKYLRKGELTKAYEVLKQIPDQFWQSFINANEWLDHDPFEVWGEESLATYTKKELLQQVLELERDATSHPAKRAQNYYHLGNFWFNLNTKTWFMVSYEQSVSFPNVWRKGEVNAWEKAKAYYELALQYETNPEKQAQINYFLTECALNLKDQSGYRKHARQFEAYQHTAFYQNINCLTTRDVVNQ